MIATRTGPCPAANLIFLPLTKLAFDDSGGDGEMGQGHGPVDSELVHEDLPMLLHGLDTDAQLCCGLLVGLAFGDES